MAKLFKGKFLSGLKQLHDNGKLSYEGDAPKYRNQYEYQELLDICYKKDWVTDIRESFAGAETVMNYLGRYTHRIAISNSRILMYVPPKGFVRIRHYGLLSNHNKRKLIPICRNLIGCREFLRRFRKEDKVHAIKILYKKDVTVCPYCGGNVSYKVCSRYVTHRKNSA